MENNLPPVFGPNGYGSRIASVLNAADPSFRTHFPADGGSGDLYLFADFSGNQSEHETHSYFLATQLGVNNFLATTRAIRQQTQLRNRRMSYKAASSDAIRRRALGAFLSCADKAGGALVSVAFTPKREGGLDVWGEDDLDQLCAWKQGALQNRVMRFVSVASYLLSSLAAPNQNIWVFVDEDDLVANDGLHRSLTDLLGNAVLAQSSHNLGNFRLGTARNDPGDNQIEDLLAVPDLAAGAIREAAAMFEKSEIRGEPVMMIRGDPERSIGPRSRIIMDWMLKSRCISKAAILVSPIVNKGRVRAVDFLPMLHLAMAVRTWHDETPLGSVKGRDYR